MTRSQGEFNTPKKNRISRSKRSHMRPGTAFGKMHIKRNLKRDYRCIYENNLQLGP